MARNERVVENLNRALHTLFERDERLYLLGEDIADPYGGAFRVTRQLTSLYPDRALTTPLSEGGIVGVANGLALCGNSVIVEVMFGDFAALAFDQLLNFTSKSVGMYGYRRPMRVVLRCPVGGNRGYGPTHSQSLQKHFIGIPHLSLHELSPFHDAERLLSRLFKRGEPAILFEPKVLYTDRVYLDGKVDDVFEFDFVNEDWVHIRASAMKGPYLAMVAPGGMVDAALQAARSLALEDDVHVRILVPSQLYPLDIGPVTELVAGAKAVCVVEEGSMGGTWGTEVARHVHEQLWDRLGRPVLLVHSRASVIPAAPHLERKVLVQADTIRAALRTLLAPPSAAASRKPGPASSADAGWPEVPVAQAGQSVVVTVPKLNNNDAAYLLLTWLARDGQRIEVGDPIAEIETSKAIQVLTAEASGTLRQIVPVGADCRPGDALAWLVAGETAASPTIVVPSNCAEVTGAATASEARTMVLSRAQRFVADLVTTSHLEIPDAFVVMQMRLDRALELERTLADDPGGPIGLLEMLVMAVASLRTRFPACFGSLVDASTIDLADEAHIGVTLDAGSGLFVPVVRSVDRRTVAEIADELAAFRLQALRGIFAEKDLTGANFVISWNHEPDVVLVQPVIPPGLACVLSVGGARREVSLTRSGQPVQNAVTFLGLTHDHRMVNGREAIAFLREVAAMVQDEHWLAELVSHEGSAT